MKNQNDIIWPKIAAVFFALFALFMTWNARNLDSNQFMAIAFQNLAIAGLGVVALRSASIVATGFALVYILSNSLGYISYSVVKIMKDGSSFFHSNDPKFHWWTYGPNIEDAVSLSITYFTVIAVFAALFQIARSKKENAA